MANRGQRPVITFEGHAISQPVPEGDTHARLVFVVTNQAGVARGYYGEEGVRQLQLSLGARPTSLPLQKILHRLR